jgi:serine/threonine-protein kinase
MAGDRGVTTSMRLLDQRYELLDHIGSGAMASVWRAHDRRLDREVAIKMLSELLASDSAFRHRFEREAVHVASLKHPNIVAVYDAGNEGDTYYIVMELVEGESLQAEIEAAAPYLGVDRTAEIAAQLLAGLGHAHGKGIVHRDIKPANILITADGTAKLVDFGIARAAGDAKRVTTMGEFMGTPAYASPEQLDARSATAATDLYSLGCVLYECLAGHPPFEAEIPVGVIAQHLQATPRSLRTERLQLR